MHPGCVRTDVTRHMSSFMQIGNYLATPIMKTLQKTPEEGAYCTIHVATSPEVDKERGGDMYFHCSVFPTSKASENIEDAKKLWDLSEKLVGLDTK